MNWRKPLLTAVLLAGLAGCSSTTPVGTTAPAATPSPWDAQPQLQEERRVRNMLSWADQQPSQADNAVLGQP